MLNHTYLVPLRCFESPRQPNRRHISLHDRSNCLINPTNEPPYQFNLSFRHRAVTSISLTAPCSCYRSTHLLPVISSHCVIRLVHLIKSTRLIDLLCLPLEAGTSIHLILFSFLFSYDSFLFSSYFFFLSFSLSFLFSFLFLFLFLFSFSSCSFSYIYSLFSA